MNFRRYFGDAHSIESYHSVMKWLEHIRAEDEVSDPTTGPPPHVRLVQRNQGDFDGYHRRHGATPRPRTGSRAYGTISGIRDPSIRHASDTGTGTPRMLFVDDAITHLPTGGDRHATSPTRGGGPRAGRKRHAVGLSLVGGDQQGSPAARPRSRTVAVVLGLTALTGGGTVLLLMGMHHGPDGAHHAPSPPRVAAAAGAVPAGTPATTPVTVQPAPTVPRLSAASVGSTSATYSVTGGRINLSVSAVSACWIDVRTTAGGPSLFAGVIPPGTQRSFVQSGSLWLRVGYPAGLRLSADGSPVPLPATSNPYNLDFVQAPTQGH